MPALVGEVDENDEDATHDDGVPVGAADLEADKENGKEDAESSSDAEDSAD